MKSEPTESGAEILAGLVERVTFHNEENGFAVLCVKARGKRDLVTVVGHAAVISAGEFIQASGDWSNDRQHGLQFRARFLKAMPATTIGGMQVLKRERCGLSSSALMTKTTYLIAATKIMAQKTSETRLEQ